MSPRRRGRGRSGGSAAAPTPEGPQAPGEQSAADGEGAAPPPNGFRTGSAPRRPPNARASAPPARTGPPARLAPRARSTEQAGVATPTGQPEPDGIQVDPESGERKPACTLAQMRRFIKSRPYVPVHELRRRFEIEGMEDEVSPMPTGQGTLFVGLPAQEAVFLGDLVKSGEVGCELLLDPVSPAVIGVYPMRPVARQ